MPTQKTQLKVINVMDPIMCLRCPHAHIAEVLFTDGATRKMFYCSRLDCDNWQSTTGEIEEDYEEYRKSA